jgi:hypothetical protein
MSPPSSNCIKALFVCARPRGRIVSDVDGNPVKGGAPPTICFEGAGPSIRADLLVDQSPFSISSAFKLTQHAIFRLPPRMLTIDLNLAMIGAKLS